MLCTKLDEFLIIIYIRWEELNIYENSCISRGIKP
jgi:hypothetical protein